MGAIDLQVNGYAGVDFNSDTVPADALKRVCHHLRDDGVEGILATVITETLPVMEARLRALVEAREREPAVAETLIGIHIEGPFLNPAPGFIGAHPAEAAQPASPAVMERLLEAAGGLTRIVTLAPECDPGMETTRFLTERGIVVAAGHCDPDLPTLHEAADAGLSMFTHLGNGCPAQLHRHDNIIQRVLSMSDRLDIGFIADGVHIPAPALRNYLQAADPQRCFFVTDAISAARLGPGSHTLGRWKLEIGEDLVARAPGGEHFVGSTATLPRIRSFARESLGLTDDEITSFTETVPRRVLGVA